jgi:hypothetical protein
MGQGVYDRRGPTPKSFLMVAIFPVGATPCRMPVNVSVSSAGECMAERWVALQRNNTIVSFKGITVVVCNRCCKIKNPGVAFFEVRGKAVSGSPPLICEVPRDR